MPSQPDLRPLRIGQPHPQGPAAIITRRAADRLRTGHLWVYRTDIEQIQPGQGSEAGPVPGLLLSVLDPRGTNLGTALFSSASQIALRLISAAARLTREQYLDELEVRLNAALTLREALAPASESNNAHRLIFSEADNLPGIVADRYNDLVIQQLLTQGTAQADVRETVTRVLQSRLNPAAILERPDPRIRELEQLPPLDSSPDANLKTETVFTINGLHFMYDASAGQKTGAFLDQRLNYAAAAKYAHGRALDVCTLPGWLRPAPRPDLQPRDRRRRQPRRAEGPPTPTCFFNPALAERNHTDWIEADAFDLLRDFESPDGIKRSEIRHDRARSTRLRQIQTRDGRRSPRVQGAEPSGAEDA